MVGLNKDAFTFHIKLEKNLKTAFETAAVHALMIEYAFNVYMLSMCLLTRLVPGVCEILYT